MDEEAGPSRPTQTTAKPRKKAGGNGKKGKIFLEDKAGLLSLIEGVTTSKDAVRQSKLERYKSSADPEEEKEKKSGEIKKEKSASEKRRLEQKKALDQAKVRLAEKAKAKKRRKKETEGVVSSPTKKKRVGFA